jgi:hypothetical protein
MISAGGYMLFERISRGARGLVILCFFVHISSALPQGRLSAQTKQSSGTTSTPASTPRDRQIAGSAIHMPLFFEANEGQTDPSVRYLTRSNGYTMFLTPTETVLVEGKTIAKNGDKFDAGSTLFWKDAKASSQSVLRMELLGANSAPEFRGLEELPGKVNYLIGKDPEKWRSSVPLYSQVQVGKVYPGVDLLFHGDEQQLEYDFIVSPGADPSQIGFRVSGAKKIEIDSDGDLVLHTASSDFRMRKPVIYQTDDSGRRAVKGGFVLNAKNQVTFDLGPYDRSQTLVIDPAINYATFLGGAATELSESLVVDSSTPGAPKVYVTGASDDITTFPEANTRIGNPTASINVYIAEIDPKKTGSGSLVYLSFIGGSTAFQSAGAGATCGSEGVWLGLDTSQGPSLVEPVIGGQTSCTDYPGSVLNPVTATGVDAIAAVVTRLVSNGGSIDHSVLLGGNKQMSNGFVFVDPSGNVLLTGPTQATNLPTTTGAYATSFNNGGTGAASGTSDCFTAKLQRSDLTPTYLSYLNVGAGSTGTGTGFSGSGCGGVIDSANGNVIYLGGNTESTVAFSGAAAGVLGFQPTFQGTQDTFLMKLDTSLSGAAELKYATYFGGGGTTGVQTGAVDLGSGIVSNSTGVVALAGHTTSNSTTNAPDIPIFNAFTGQTTNKAANSTNQETGFFTIMDTTKSGSASLLCGSYFGGSSGFDVIRSLAFDPLVPSGYYIIVGGHTESADFPTSNAFQSALVGAQDGFVSGLMVNTGTSPSAEVFFSSYIGGGGDEEIDGLGLDTNHTIYATGSTTSANYFGNTSPATTVNGFQTTCTSCTSPAAPQPDAVIFALTSATSASLESILVSSKGTGTLAIGNTLQFSALGAFNDGTFQDLTNSATWTSSDTAVATVNSSGLVTAVGNGTSMIAAAENGQSNSQLVSVGGSTGFTVQLVLEGVAFGTVTDNAGKINCTNNTGQGATGTCSATYTSGTQVILTQAANPGSVFGGWGVAEGDATCSGATTTCTFTVDEQEEITATFNNGAGDFTLNVTPGTGATGGGVVTGAGSITCQLNGTAAPTGTCSASLASGSIATLNAEPNSTSTFAGWSGACTGAAKCVVTMSQAQTATALFSTQQDIFTVTITGNGSVTSTSNPTIAAELNCANPGPPSVCNATFTSGTSVTLTATPGTGEVFTGWTAGPCNASPQTTCTFTVSTTTPNAVAAFAATTFLLTVNRAGNGGGTVTSNAVNVQGGGISCGPAAGIVDCSVNATFNAAVVLTETPPTGSTGTFSGSTPTACTVGGGGTTCSFNMPAAAETVTVTFASGSAPLPSLEITKSHTGNFTQGQQGATYTVTVSNGANAGPTTGTVTVTDTIPAGLTLASMAGTGWTCSANNCTRSDALAGGTSYPVITVTVNVASTATSPQVNMASVSGGGSAAPPAASDSTVITTSGTAPTFTLNITAASGATGNGVVSDTSGAINCTLSGTSVPTGTCSANFPSGTVATLTGVAADDGSIFTGWSGPCSGNASCAVTMTQNQVVIARFTTPATQLIVADFDPDGDGEDDKQRIDGKSAPLQILLTNTSTTQTVNFTGAPTSTAGYSATTDCTSLAPDQSCHVFISFTATSVCQNVQGTVTLADNDPGGSFVIGVNGYGADTGIQVSDLTNSALSAQSLAQSLVGPGVQISNVTYKGAPRAAGNFTSSSNIIGFTSGVVLSTGSVRNVVGPNCSDDISVDNGQPGDADLNTIVGAGNDTNDAAVLEFDFVPTSSVISFQYVFASDEYNEFVGEFNDVFGFFLTDKATNTTTNIALIPGTNLPVSINNVNGGNPLGTNPVNPQFYINNDFPFGSTTPAPVDTEMDGLTVVFTAQAQVVPNNTYHIKLAIADADDFALDSNVFIQAGSLVSSALTLTPGTLGFGNQAVGTTSTPLPVVIQNTGSQTVTIQTIAASANFTQTNSCPATLTAVGTDGASCTVNVAFAPGTSGSLTGTLTVTFTIPGDTTPQTQIATLTGTGTGTGVTLTVTEAGTGTGTVTSNPAGISCQPTCSAGFASGTVITLTATASTGSTFTGWGAGPCEGTGTCTLTITAATTVVANFTQSTNNFTLTVNEAGTGTGTVLSAPAGINCPTTCSASFASGAVVALTATAAEGSTFGGWSGAGCTGTGGCSVTMTAAQTVTATFNSGNSPVTIGLAPGSPSTVNTTPGSSAVFGLTLTALPGTTGTVTLGCTSTSPNITCNIVPSSITLTGKAINVAIVVNTFCKGAVPAFGPSVPGGLVGGLGMLLAGMSLCGALWTFKKRPRLALSFGVLVLIAVGMSACSSLPKSPGGTATKPGLYPLVVTATAPNGAVSSVNLSLNVLP